MHILSVQQRTRDRRRDNPWVRASAGPVEQQAPSVAASVNSHESRDRIDRDSQTEGGSEHAYATCREYSTWHDCRCLDMIRPGSVHPRGHVFLPSFADTGPSAPSTIQPSPQPPAEELICQPPTPPIPVQTCDMPDRNFPRSLCG